MAVIVFPPIMDWGFMKQRPQQLMQQLARAGHTVYYCNKTQALDLVRDMKEKLDERNAGREGLHTEACAEESGLPSTSPVHDAFVESCSPLFSAQSVVELEERLYLVKRHSVWLEQQWPSIRRHAAGRTIIWCTLPQLAEQAKQYGADFLVYDCVDDFPELAPYDPAMVAAADWVVCTSERIHSRLRRQYPGIDISLVRNGYDTDMGLHLPCQEAQTPLLPNIGSGRWVGYVGAWAPWVDAALLKRLAGRLPQGDRIVIIGPEFGRREGQSLLHIGQIPHALLPAYIRKLAVCLIPFLPTPVALAANPIKAYEYLAAGKPVVATALPECMQMNPHIDCCRSTDSFIHMVLHRLREPGDCSARIRYAMKHTWAARVQELTQAIPVLSAE